MSISDIGTPGPDVATVCHSSSAISSGGVRSLHRIATVRRQQGMTLRRVVHQLGVSADQVRAEENETFDLRLSRLYEWQRVLEVPLAELLCDHDAPLSAPVMERARMVRLMKTAAAIMEKSTNTSIQRLAQMLVTQLLEIMPELEGVTAWHSVGQRRSMDELGRTFERMMPSRVFREP